MLLQHRYLLSVFLMVAITSPPMHAAAAKKSVQHDLTTKLLTARDTDKLDSQLTPQQEKRLDILFTRLASSDNEGAAQQLTAEIWSIWRTPKDDALLAQMNEAEQLFARGQHAAAFKILDAATATYPGYSEIWNQRATYYYFANRHEDSLADIAKVLELEPRHFGALSGKVAILLKKNRMEAAVRTLQQALKINPFMPERQMLIPAQKDKPKGLPI